MQAIVAVSQSWGIGRDGSCSFASGPTCSASRPSPPVTRWSWAAEPWRRSPAGPGSAGSAQPGADPAGKPSPPDRAETVHSPEELLALADSDAFVIGGQEVYTRLLPHCTRVYVTKVFADVPADAFFPNLDKDPHWQVVSVGEPQEEAGLRFQYVEYRRV